MSELAIRRRRFDTGRPKEPELIRRHRPDYLLLIFVVLLMMLGLVVLYSIQPALQSTYETGFVGRQIIFTTVGISVFLLTSRIKLKFFETFATTFFVTALALSLLLSLLSLLPGSPMVACVNGACRWLDLGFTTFQPVEYLKFALVMYLAVFLAARIREGTIANAKETLLPVGIATGLAGLLIVVFQQDLGSGLILLAITAVMVFVAGLPGKHLLWAFGAMAAMGVLSIVAQPHRIERVLTFFGSSAATEASNYHSQQALIAIGSGGFFGKGLANGVQAFGYLPEAANDSIFAVIAEAFGFVGTLAILLIFGGLIYRLVLLVERSQRPEFKLIAAGITAWVGAHIFVNIAAMMGVVPLTGITLPFLSFGGSSLLLTMVAMGVAFSLSRYTAHKKDINTDKEAARDESNLRGRRVRRPRHTDPSRYQRT